MSLALPSGSALPQSATRLFELSADGLCFAYLALLCQLSFYLVYLVYLIYLVYLVIWFV